MSVRYDWVMVALCSWFLGGLYLDGWAHNHGVVDDSFFTPWHGVFYSGFLAVAILLVVPLIRRHGRGSSWRQALPAGYDLALLGAIIFLAGGVGDMIWHIVFGLEENIEALLSPTHLTLAVGGMLMLSGPFRAAWRRPQPQLQGWPIQVPMLLSLTCILSLLTFMTQFAHPLVEPWSAAGYQARMAFYGQVTDRGMRAIVYQQQAVGVVSILLQTGLLMGLLLLAIRRWGQTLLPGALTLILTLNAVAMSFMHDQYRLLPGALLAGVAADVLYHRLKPSTARPLRLRLLAFAVPVIFYSLYFMGLLLTEGIWWSTHLWAGSIVVAGVVGWLVSYLVVIPSWSEEVGV